MSRLPAGPFGCLLVDPPWRFQTYDGDQAVATQARDPYLTMTRSDLLSLPVRQAAAPDCALFLWYLGTHADQMLELGGAWGFRFVRSEVFIWIKEREGQSPPIGPGYWSRNGAECCALFKRGSPRVLSHGVEQVIFCRRGAHSAKPDQQYDRIEALVGGPRLELFARSRRPGWEAWGNEVGARDGPLFANASFVMGETA